MDCGSGNTRRLVDVNTICVNLEEVCNGLTCAVPSFHAFTGTDNTCSFYGKGKIKPWKLLLNNLEYVNFFQSLSNIEEANEVVAQKFVLPMYSLSDCKNVDSGRHTKICQMSGLQKMSKQYTLKIGRK